MTRNELFKEFFPERGDSAALFDNEYSQLRELWNQVPEEHREEMLALLTADIQGDPLPPLPTEGRHGVSEVQQQYRYRLASQFAVNLPPYFRRVMMLADDIEMMDLLFFGTLAALSVAMPGVHGSFMQDRILPNLYLFITGYAASGKGKVNYCRRLLIPLERRYPSPFVIPGDSTSTIFNRALHANGGRGIIFESEADTLSDALKRPQGHFSSGLRKAFHNEPISFMRSTDNEWVTIPEPVLSCLLTGTPGQLAGMFKDKSAENGLFTRFLFYRLGGNKESFVYNKEEHGHVTGDMLNSYLDLLGEQLCQFFERLEERDGLIFRLTDAQEQLLVDTMHDETLRYEELFGEAYKDAIDANNAISIMRRIGNICYRIMMILSTSRLIGEDTPLPDEVVCDQRDFDTVMRIIPTLMYHNALHYDEYMVSLGRFPALDDEDPDTGDMLNPAQRLFFQSLPERFIAQEALQVSAKLALSVRTARRYLTRFCELGILKRCERGSYKKTGRGQIDETPSA